MPERYKEFTKEINEYGCQSDVRDREGGKPERRSSWNFRIAFPCKIHPRHAKHSQHAAREMTLICYYDTIANEKKYN